jgi:glycosyltransferase involved in cell wall biosynthesis
VFSIGTQTHDKGSHQLVEAVKLLWRKIPEVNLVLAGEVLSDFSAYLSRQQLGASGRFFNLGQIGEDDKTDLLASGDLMVLPSRADSFGITYLEAWFYGKPVIGCFAGGVPEVIDDGVDGFLVPFGEAHLLAEYLEKLLLDGALAEKMGQRGRQKVLEKFTWDQVYQRVKTAVEKKFFAG